ncbi:MAG: hypothetical protein ACYS8W_17895 [Planctomycetota bacterium]|jgi:type II secretory pathway component HofQ
MSYRGIVLTVLIIIVVVIVGSLGAMMFRRHARAKKEALEAMRLRVEMEKKVDGVFLDIELEEGREYSVEQLKKMLAVMKKVRGEEELTDEGQRIIRVLKTRRVSLHFQDTPLNEVIAFLQDITGLNIEYSKEALKYAVKNEPTVSLSVQNEQMGKALRAVLKSANKGGKKRLGYVLKDGITIILVPEIK